MNSEIRILKWIYIIIWTTSIFKVYKNTDLINVLSEKKCLVFMGWFVSKSILPPKEICQML